METSWKRGSITRKGNTNILMLLLCINIEISDNWENSLSERYKSLQSPELITGTFEKIITKRNKSPKSHDLVLSVI